jgi:hypothetical protein
MEKRKKYKKMYHQNYKKTRASLEVHEKMRILIQRNCFKTRVTSLRRRTQDKLRRAYTR